MKSRVTVAKHPLHPMLIVVPSAIFPLLLLLDVVGVWTGADMERAGFWLALAGVVSTLAAMVPGIVDLSAIPDKTKAHKTAFSHFVVGSLTLVAYGVAAWVRWTPGDSFGMLLAIDLVGTLLITIQGWLGGELVYKFHLAVNTTEEGAEPTPFETKGAPARADAEMDGRIRPQ